MHSLTRSFMTALLLAVLAASGTRAQVRQDRAPVSSTAVHPLFDWSGPDTAPFPSDRFAVKDDPNLTRRRVNLPKPADCVATKSECDDANFPAQSGYGGRNSDDLLS